ncbi:DUF6093 family protein [Streptomyces sp. NPDC056169]|uniref:DUF6093 family protein n=1 Tax=Streptomyces sp. NPDC056169 TaxID=3345734 RepID=UPI0035D87797
MAGLDKALAGATRWIEGNLCVDTVRVRGAAPTEAVLDPDTGDLVYPERPVLYEGPGAVVPFSIAIGRSVTPDESRPWIQQNRSAYVLITPLTAPIPPEGALVDVTAVHDPSRTSLIGRTWLAADRGQASTVEVVRRTALDQNHSPRTTP